MSEHDHGEKREALRPGWALRREPWERAELIGVALGKKPADLVIKGANVYNPYDGEFHRGDLAVSQGRVAGLGSYKGLKEVRAEGAYLIAGFIDSHVHIESSMAGPLEFAKCISAYGTTTVVADPHEIANVAGAKGFRWLIEATENLPVNVFVMVPSCVPATPLERGAGIIGPQDIPGLLGAPRVLGLAEMMNFPGVLAGDLGVLAKLTEAPLVDGHAPGLTGPALAAYVGAGIGTDHECVLPGQAAERLSMGQNVLLRQGTAAKNLLELLPAVTPMNSRFCQLATDDRHAQDLHLSGSINYLVALALRASGVSRPTILNMATLNAALHYGLRDLGALTPGKIADMALYPDLYDFKPIKVWKAGKAIAENGRSTFVPPPGQDAQAIAARDRALRDTVRLGPVSLEDLAIQATGTRIRVIGVVPGQVLTEHLIMSVPPIDGQFRADPGKDLCKLVVFPRYGDPWPPAKGFIWGLGLRRGAIASTVSHDSHNLIVAGMSDPDILACAKALEAMGGGLALALNGKVIASLALPLGGLMSELSLGEISAALDGLRMKGAELGFDQDFDPFMTLAFMSLPVIPSLKLTVKGLVDVQTFQYVPVVLE
ncbi:MAG: adenine deaminase [Deltaproteobacteria bacterium]|nr:adenine deaminase [Deltaproteobacteria bacterium]